MAIRYLVYVKRNTIDVKKQRASEYVKKRRSVCRNNNIVQESCENREYSRRYIYHPTILEFRASG